MSNGSKGLVLKATLLVSFALWSRASAAAGPAYSIGYGGRAADAKGAPIAGPVDLKVSFFRTATGGEAIIPTVLDFPATPLTQGVFQITMSLPAAEFAAVFADVSQPVFIQVTDSTHSVTYPRQQFLMVPFAAKVPVDGATITYDTAGQLTLTNPPGTTANSLVQLDSASRLPAVDGSQLTGVMATGFTGKLTGDVSGGQASTTVTKIQGQPVAAVGATSGQVLTWVGGQWAPATPAAGSGSPISGPVNLSQAGAVTGTLAVANGGTGSGTTLNNNSLMISSGGAIVEAPALGNGQFFIGSAGTAPVAATLSQGTTQGVTVTAGAGSLALDTVQDIRTSATPLFSGLTLANPAVGSVVKVGTGGTLVAAAPADLKATLGYTPVNKAGDGMTGSLGIGTTSATTTLDIAGAFTERGSAPPTVAPAGQGRLYFDSTANQFMVSQNGGTYASLLSGGTITGVTAGTGMTGGGTSGNVTVGLTSVGTAGIYTKVLTDANGRVTSGTSLVAADLPPISASLLTSGTLSTAVIPALPASQITSGTFAVAQIPTLPPTQISGTLALSQIPTLPPTQISGTLALSQIPALPAAQITSGTLAVAQIPALPASQITSGTLALAQIPALPASEITGTLSTAQLPSLSLGEVTTGTLAVSLGGTGATSFTNNGIVVGGGPGPLSTIAGGSQYSVLTVNASSQPVFGALNLGSAAAVSGTLPIASGGTGSSTALSNNRLMLSAGGAIVEAPALGNGQLFIGSAGNAPSAATLTQGGTQGVTFTTGSGSLTLDTAQDIRTSATPLFSGLTLANPAVGSVVKVGTGGTLVAAAGTDLTTALGYTPVNKAGDTMGGSLSLGDFDLTGVGNLGMAPLKTLAMGTFTTDPSGLGTADVGKTWFNTTSNQLKYWDGSTAQALGVSGAGLTSLNGQSGSTQTFGVPGVAGLSPAWSSASNTHTLNIPLASAASVTAGLLSNTDYQTFSGKVSKSGDTMTGSLGIGTTSAETTLDIAGAFTERAISPPAVAPVGQGRLYFDSTANQFMVSQNGGSYTALASGGTITGVTAGTGMTGGGTSGNVTVGLTSVGTAGNYTKVLTDANGRVTSGTTLVAADLPPISANLLTSGTLSTSVIPALSASQITSGTFAAAQIPTLPPTQISGTLAVAQIPALPAAQITSGTFAAAQIPTLPPTQISGTLALTQLPALPASQITSGTLALAQIPALPATQFSGTLAVGQIPALPASQITSGTFALAQIPALPATQISGTLAAGQIPSLPASQITSGTLALAQLPTLPASQITSGTLAPAQIPTIPSSQVSGTLAAAQIPALPASQITSGTLALAQLPALPASQITSGTLAVAQIPALPATQITGTLSTTQLPSLSLGEVTTGTLAVALGGTGATGFTSNGIVVGGGGSPLSATAAGSQYNILTVNASNQPVFGALNLGQTAAVTGTLPVASGGTGSSTALGNNRLMMSSGGTIVEAPALTNGQLFVGSTGAAPAAATLAQGATQGVTFTAGAGSLTLDTAQDIRTSATPLFSSLKLSNPAVGSVVKVGTGGTLVTAAAGDLTTALGYTPVNKAGDTMTGPLSHGGFDLLNVGNIDMAPSKTLAMGTFTTDPSGLGTSDVGKAWFNTTSNQLKYWDGSTSQALGVSGAGLTNLNGQSGSTQTFGVPGVSGLSPTWTSASNTHTLNIPLAAASSVTAGLLSNTDYQTFTGKVSKTGDTMTGSLGIGTTSAETTLDIAGALTERAMSAPAVAPSGQGRLYFDSTANQFMVSQNGGAYTALASGGTLSGVTAGTGLTGGGTSGSVSLALTSVGTAGTYTKVQTDANGRVTSGTTLAASDLPPHSAALVTSGTLAVAQIPALPASQITTGTFAVAQLPAIPSTQISGTLAAAQIPALPASQITSGTFALAQLPAIPSTQISGTLAAAQIPALPASQITSGTFALAQLPALPASQITSGTLALAQLPALPASQITSGTLAVAQIPALPATQITGTLSTAQLPSLSLGEVTTGTLAVALGGTGGTGFTSNGVVVGGGGSPLSATAAGSQYNVLTVNASNQPVFGALNLGQTAAVTGTLPVASGGTGSSTALNNNRLMLSSGGTIIEAPALTSGQIFVGSTGAAPAAATLAQGATQGVTFTAGAGSLTLDTAQDIRTSATPLFSSLKLTNPAVGSLVKVGTGSTLVAAAAADLTGTLGYTPVNKAGDAMTGNLTTTGTVGIGTTSAETALDVAGALTERAITAPAVAPVGQGRLYFDTTTNQFMVSENGGAYAALGVGGTISGVTAGTGLSGGGTSGSVSLALTSVGTAGTYTKVQTDANGRVTSGTTLAASDLPPHSAALVTSGTLAVAQIPALPASQITTGTFAVAQLPAIPSTQISGTLAAAQIPALPASQITSGTFALAQLPAIPSTQISGTLAAAQIPALPASQITSGTLALAQIPALPASQITSGTLAVAQIPALPATQITGTLSTAQLPSLSLGEVTTGTLAVALGGTGGTSFTSNGVVIGGGASPLSATTAGSQYNVLTVNASNQPVFGALNLGQTAAVTGTLPVASGGTGSSTALNNNRLMLSSGGTIIEAPALTSGQIFVGSTGAAPAAATLAQGATQGVTFTAGAGSLTLDTAQDIRTSATPLFSSLKLTNPAVGSLVKVGTGSTLVAAAAADLTGTLGYTPVNKAGDAMTGNLTTTGTVGIGTTSAETALDVAGALTERAITAPAVAPVGQGRLYFDTTTNQFMVSENGGAYAALGVGGTISGVTAGTGLAGGGTSGSVTLTLTSVGTSGTYTKVQTDANGRVTSGTTLAASDLPPHSAALVTSGTLAVAQIPALPASQITSGTLAVAQLPALPASQITSGTLALAQLPAIPSTQISGTLAVAQLPAIPSTQLTGTLAVAQIPALPATQITGTLSTAQLPSLSLGEVTTGTLAVALGGTGGTSFTNNGVVVGGGGSPLSATAAGIQYNVLTVNASNQPVFGALNLGQTAAVTGTLPVASGGTGSSTALNNNRHMVSSGGIIVEAPALTNGQLFIGSTGAAPVAATLAQGATQGVTFTAGAGSLTLDTAQDIRTSATPLFSSLKLTNPAVGSLVKVGTGSTLVAAAAADLTGALGFTPVNKAGDTMTGTLNLPANGFAVGTTQLLVSGGNVGIGTATPAQPLDVSGNFRFSGGLYSPATSANFLTDTGTALPVKAGSLVVSASYANAAPTNGLYVQGSVGIGTTSPAQPLDVAGNLRVTGGIYSNAASANFLADAGGALPAKVGGLVVSASYAPSAPTNGLYVQGNVGIGTTTPGTALDLAGALTERAMTAPAVAPVGQGRIYFDSGSNQFLLSQNGGAYATLATGGTITGVTAGTGLSGGGTSGSVTVSLPNLGTAGTYTKVVTDANGRVTNATTLAASDLPPFSAALVTSGTLSTSVIPSLAASQINSGTFAAAQIPSLPATQISGTLAVAQLPSLPASQITSGTLAAAQLPAHSAALTTSGTLAIGVGGTGSTTALNNNRLMWSSGGAIVEAPALTNGQLFIGSSGAAPSATTLAQGATQGVTLTAGAGSLTLDTAQDIRTSATPLFSSLKLSNPTVGSIVKVGTGSTLVAAAASDITTALGYTPVNKAGDTMTGTLNLPANGFTVGTSQLLVSGGNVGIGTGTPQYALHAVKTGNTGTAAEFLYGDDYGAAIGVNSTSSSYYALNVTSGINSAGVGGTSLLYVRNDGNVGIGTTSPVRNLDVKGMNGLTVANTNFAYGSSGSSLAIMPGASSGNTYYQIVAFNSGETAMGNLVLQNGGGNVGIGTTSPYSQLQVHTTTNGNMGMRLNGQPELFTANDANNTYTPMYINANPIVLNTNSGANVGIGTTAPSAKFDVESSTSQAVFGTGDSRKQLLINYDTVANVAAIGVEDGYSIANLAFRNNGAERMRITPAGNVGIGTTTPSSLLNISGSGWNNSTGGDFLIVNSSTVGSSVTLQSTGSGGGTFSILSTASGANTGAGALGVWDNVNSAYRLVISSTGNVGIGSISPNFALDITGNTRTTGCFKTGAGGGSTLGGSCSSDLRFKKAIQPITGALGKLSLLNPVQYKFRTDEFPDRQFSTGVEYGFIAQELEPVFPELVTTDNDGYKRVNYGLELHMQTIAAVKELNAEVVQLTTDDAQLKADNAQLKGDNAQLKADNVQLKADNEAIKALLCETYPGAKFCTH